MCWDSVQRPHARKGHHSGHCRRTHTQSLSLSLSRSLVLSFSRSLTLSLSHSHSLALFLSSFSGWGRCVYVHSVGGLIPLISLVPSLPIPFRPLAFVVVVSARHDQDITGLAAGLSGDAGQVSQPGVVEETLMDDVEEELVNGVSHAAVQTINDDEDVDEDHEDDDVAEIVEDTVVDDFGSGPPAGLPGLPARNDSDEAGGSAPDGVSDNDVEVLGVVPAPRTPELGVAGPSTPPGVPEEAELVETGDEEDPGDDWFDEAQDFSTSSHSLSRRATQPSTTSAILQHVTSHPTLATGYELQVGRHHLPVASCSFPVATLASRVERPKIRRIQEDGGEAADDGEVEEASFFIHSSSLSPTLLVPWRKYCSDDRGWRGRGRGHASEGRHSVGRRRR